MMAIAIIASISFLGPFTRTFAAFLGGAGFGWFIDELGKFITRDVNYFFQPTFALIYMTFIAMYLAFRSLERRGYSPEEGTLNALEALKSAALGQLDEPVVERRCALRRRTLAGIPARRVRELLDDACAATADSVVAGAVAATLRSRHGHHRALRFPPSSISSSSRWPWSHRRRRRSRRRRAGVVTFTEWAALVRHRAALIVIGARCSTTHAWRRTAGSTRPLVHIYVADLRVRRGAARRDGRAHRRPHRLDLAAQRHVLSATAAMELRRGRPDAGAAMVVANGRPTD
jgi:hypothetical protein